MRLERIDEVIATGFRVYFWKHYGIDVRRLRLPLHWGWSWESALYVTSRRWMITIG